MAKGKSTFNIHEKGFHAGRDQLSCVDHVVGDSLSGTLAIEPVKTVIGRNLTVGQTIKDFGKIDRINKIVNVLVSGNNRMTFEALQKFDVIVD